MDVYLPRIYRRAYTRAFGVTLIILTGLVCGIASLLLNRRGVGFSVTTAILFFEALIILLRPDWALTLYRTWNERLVRPYANLVRSATIRICFWCVFALAGRGASRFLHPAVAPDSSLWRALGARDAQIVRVRTRRHSGAEAFARLAWVREYCGWASSSRNISAIVLLPFLAILRWCGPMEEQAVASNIYTLF